MMISTLKDMLPDIGSWPTEDQVALVEFARELEAVRLGVYRVSPEEEVAIAEGIAEADRNQFATDEEMAALLKRYRE